MPAPALNFIAAHRLPGGMRRSIVSDLPTIPTTGAVNEYIIAPERAYLDSVEVSAVESLIASDTNYITFTITNLGQGGLGTGVMLAATPSNTTKVTGGSAFVANARKVLAVNPTLLSTLVEAGDRLRITATVTGTLPNTLTFPKVLLRFA